MKYPPLTTAALINYNHLNPFSEVVPAEKMAELERKVDGVNEWILEKMKAKNTTDEEWNVCANIQDFLK